MNLAHVLLRIHRLRGPRRLGYGAFQDGGLLLSRTISNSCHGAGYLVPTASVYLVKEDPMSNVSVSQVFTVSPAALWELVGAPERLAAWHPAIAQSPVQGDSRTCTLADGATIQERITAHSDAERRYSYRIVEGPLPMRDYQSTLSVEPEGDGARLTWEAQFEAVGAPAADVESMVRGLYEAGMQSIGTHFG